MFTDLRMISKTNALGWLNERFGSLISLAVLGISVLALIAVNPTPLGYFDISTISASATTLALAAMGETLVILSGGLDLSAGAIVSLVNVVLVTQLGAAEMHPVLYGLVATGIGVGLGGLIGAVNGFFVGYLRLQPIIVTLATMFVAQGAALLVLKYPGGEFDYDFSMVLVGDAWPGVLPAPFLVLAVAVTAWLVLRRTRLGTAIYAVGNDASAAATNRVDVAATRFRTFAAAGAFYGAAGVFVTANSGAGDPLIGAAMLLKIFAAVVLGGTLIGGGRGGAVGTVFGALTLTILVNLFLVAGIRTYYVPIVEGLVLILAVLGFEAGRGLPILGAIRHMVAGGWAVRRRVALQPPQVVPVLASTASSRPTWWLRNAATLRFVLPAWFLLLAAVIATAVINGSDFSFGNYLVTLFVFASFLAVLGVGQGAVVLAGGLDLSIAWAITFPAIVVTTFADGSDANAIWVMPLALVIGALIGLVNGILVVGARLSPIIATLATASVLEGITLVFSDGAPTGAAPPMLAWFINGRLLDLPPVLYFLAIFVLLATLLLDRSAFGRRLHAVGLNPWVAKLSGVRTGAIVIAAYVLSGLCAALVGLLLTGFTAQAYYDMGKPYLLSSIAVVVLGGTSITGGRGHYLGILGGALLFTALSSMLASTSLPEAMRSIIYGLVLMGAVIMLREREQS